MFFIFTHSIERLRKIWLSIVQWHVFISKHAIWFVIPETHNLLAMLRTIFTEFSNGTLNCSPEYLKAYQSFWQPFKERLLFGVPDVYVALAYVFHLRVYNRKVFQSLSVLFNPAKLLPIKFLLAFFVLPWFTKPH